MSRAIWIPFLYLEERTDDDIEQEEPNKVTMAEILKGMKETGLQYGDYIKQIEGGQGAVNRRK